MIIVKRFVTLGKIRQLADDSIMPPLRGLELVRTHIL
jgi:hypothetical protein